MAKGTRNNQDGLWTNITENEIEICASYPKINIALLALNQLPEGEAQLLELLMMQSRPLSDVARSFKELVKKNALKDLSEVKIYWQKKFGMQLK